MQKDNCFKILMKNLKILWRTLKMIKNVQHSMKPWRYSIGSLDGGCYKMIAQIEGISCIITQTLDLSWSLSSIKYQWESSKEKFLKRKKLNLTKFKHNLKRMMKIMETKIKMERILIRRKIPTLHLLKNHNPNLKSNLKKNKKLKVLKLNHIFPKVSYQ